MTRIDSLESTIEWLNSWSDGPHWSDPTGETVPIAKDALRDLLVRAQRMQSALINLRSRALMRVPGSIAEFSAATAASIALICDEALT